MPDEYVDENANVDDIINPVEEKNPLEERVRNLSKSKREAEEAMKKENEARVQAEKERDFYASFTDSTAKYPTALEYKDQIKEKVMAGYSVEDATVSILAKEGKFQPQQPQQIVERELVAGGSALNQIPDGGTKSIADMTREEKRQALKEADLRGEIEPILRRGFN